MSEPREIPQHMVRVMKEKEELDSRILKLKAFLLSGVLDGRDHKLMVDQLSAMNRYSLILGERIKNI